MHEKGDCKDVFTWNSVFSSKVDPDLDAWTTKCHVEQSRLHPALGLIPKRSDYFSLVGAVSEDAITHEQDDLINDVNVSSESSTSLMMCGLRVPTPIFLDGRYTPIFRYSSTSNENVAIDTPKQTDLDDMGQEEMDLEDISPVETDFDAVDRPAKSSRLSRIFRGIHGFFRSKKRNGFNRL